MEKLGIQFTLFSAFYSPLISVMSGGFLRAEGLDAEWSVSPPGTSAIAALTDGTAQVAQVGKLIGPCGFSILAAPPAAD